MTDGFGFNVNDVTDGITGEADPDEGEDDAPETPYAEMVGLRAGILPGLAALYALLIGPNRLLDLNPVPGDLFLVRTDAGNPLILVAVVTICTGLLAGIAYVVLVDEIEEGHEIPMAMSLVLPPAGVGTLGIVLVLLEPVLNLVIAGDLVMATVMFVIEAVVVAIAVGSTIGILAMVLVFGIYLGIPSVVGVYAGSFATRLVVD